MRSATPSVLLAALLVCPVARATATEGYLDDANAAQIGGWARAPDYTGPVMVHIYIAGALAILFALLVGALLRFRP